VAYTTFGYDRDGKVTTVQFADGRGMAIGYDGFGRVDKVDAGAGELRVAYDSGAKDPHEYFGPTERFERRFDGPDVIAEAWAGTVSSTITRELDARSRVIADVVGSSPRIEYEYDTTGLIVRAGELSLTRDPTTGLIASERIGALERTWQYNSFGEVVGGTVTASGRPLYEFRVVRDLLARLLRRVERAQN